MGYRGRDNDQTEASPVLSRVPSNSDDLRPGYRMRAGSASRVHRREDHRYGSDYNHVSRNRGYGSERDTGRYRDPSPPYDRGSVGSGPIGRDTGRYRDPTPPFDRPSFIPGPVRGDSNSRNKFNVRPREGDWICPDPLCGYLNFEKRNYCNRCNRCRYALPRGFAWDAFDGPSFSPGLDRGDSNSRINFNVSPWKGDWICPDPLCGYLNFEWRNYCNSCNRCRNGPAGSPRRAYPVSPSEFARDGPTEYGSAALPPLRHEGRFDRSPPVGLVRRHHGIRRGFERRPLSSPEPLLPSFPPRRDRRYRS